jgi:PPK2 family polyphosphate:nucleotide phosphotransferase
MFTALDSPYLVPDTDEFTVGESRTTPPADSPGKRGCKKRLKAASRSLRELQQVLYADDRHAVLLIFQAMDAAGKDGTIRSVLTGVNPAGCQVYSFKQPSATELDHDFLWRTTRSLPERGRIGVFNRSYYEEVLVVRVHPKLLDYQRLPVIDRESIWQDRLASIRSHERHLAENGTVVLKFWLNVSREEQRRRFLSRLDEPEKNWKFSVGDVEERKYWDIYMKAYEAALRATSTRWAPWYAVPADSKPYMRMVIAELLVRTLERLGLEYPKPDAESVARFQEMRTLLEGEK